jgi:hypothetical protein
VRRDAASARPKTVAVGHPWPEAARSPGLSTSACLMPSWALPASTRGPGHRLDAPPPVRVAVAITRRTAAAPPLRPWGHPWPPGRQKPGGVTPGCCPMAHSLSYPRQLQRETAHTVGRMHADIASWRAAATSGVLGLGPVRDEHAPKRPGPVRSARHRSRTRKRSPADRLRRNHRTQPGGCTSSFDVREQRAQTSTKPSTRRARRSGSAWIGSSAPAAATGRVARPPSRRPATRPGHLDDLRVRTTPSRGSGFRATSTSSLWRYNQRRSMDGRATFGSPPLRAVDSALPWNYSLEQEI